MNRKAIGLVLAALLAACGSQASEGSGAASPEPATASPEPAEAELALTDSDLGQILVDGEGRTLYRFERDSDGTSTCYADCAGLWPPVAADAASGEGVDEALLGSIERDDGSKQLTYANRPLYYYAQDVQPGDTNGQGVNDVWFVVDAGGAAVTAPAG